MTKKKEPSDQGPIGSNADGTGINIVPPGEASARLAEIREMRESEGYDMSDDEDADEPPPGSLPDGKLNVVSEDDPPFVQDREEDAQ